MRYAQIIGWGKYVPSKILTNDDLAVTLDTSDAWIHDRTGIRERRIAAPKETTASLAVRAAWAALEVANISPSKLGLIIVATCSPDNPGLPATACLVQDALSATHAGAFDLMAGCTGFIYGLSLGSQVVQAEGSDYVLVIGAETLSRIVDYTDRSTAILFGDGAGAVVLGPSDRPGILSYILGSDGSGAEALSIPAGGSRQPASRETVDKRLHYVKMDGRAVFRFAVRVLGKAAGQALQKAGLTVDDVDLLIPHQANLRIIQSAVAYLKLPAEKVFCNLERYGNTSAASIPIALCEAIEQNRLHSDDCLVLTGFGAGLTWGAAVVRWGVPTPAKPLSFGKRWWFRLRHLLATGRSWGHRLWRKIDATWGPIRG
jgi:3-oxoacyl-[acyl-carrier-protein] synthase-3